MSNYLKTFDTIEQAQKAANALKSEWPEAMVIEYFDEICIFLASDDEEIALDVFLADDGDCVERFMAKLKSEEPECKSCNDRGCNICLMLNY